MVQGHAWFEPENTLQIADGNGAGRLRQFVSDLPVGFQSGRFYVGDVGYADLP
ncbi:hypothetical protein P4H87_04545 [Paenibacillus macerans]|nr:hypothetical protein [Paenibacillus macerans]MCY7558436.1 hypothetical protein [Paenibacillus macerans]MEC0149871.1 hypothetical protein [Paenibacillus macerans]GIP11781.1 hypothetical protein J1TS5_39510 [Paenibacillus macerans]